MQYIGWSLIEGHVQNMYGNRGYGAFIKAELQPTEVDPCFKTFLNQNLVWKIDTFVILELSCVRAR